MPVTATTQLLFSYLLSIITMLVASPLPTQHKQSSNIRTSARIRTSQRIQQRCSSRESCEHGIDLSNYGAMALRVAAA
jgi:hypothetical protein